MRKSTARFSLSAVTVMTVALVLLPFLVEPVLAKNYIFRTSNTPMRVEALGVNTVNSVVTVGNTKHYGLYVVDAPKNSALGTDMLLNPGMVILTLDGYSVTTARQADNWIAHRPHKPLIFTYAAIIAGKPQIFTKEIASRATLHPNSGEIGSNNSSSSKPDPLDKQYSVSELESACISMINESRRRNGLSDVSRDGSLSNLARKYADYMAAHPEGFEITVSRSPHIDLQGRNPQQRASEAGISNQVFENIGRASRSMFDSDMRQLRNLHKSMMDEGPGGGHYETIMNPQARSVGVGVARGPSRFYLTEEFSN